MTVIEEHMRRLPRLHEVAPIEAPRDRRRPDYLGTITLASVHGRGIDGYGQVEALAYGTPSPALSPIPCASMGAARPSRSPFLKKRLMSTVFDEVEGRFFGAAASAV
jgi:hypothetical protein